MIRQVDKSRFNIPMSSHPDRHRELMWYATEDDAVLGVVILDLVDKDYSWVVLTENDQGPGYTAIDMGASLMGGPRPPAPAGGTGGLRRCVATKILLSRLHYYLTAAYFLRLRRDRSVAVEVSFKGEAAAGPSPLRRLSSEAQRRPHLRTMRRCSRMIA